MDQTKLMCLMSEDFSTPTRMSYLRQGKDQVKKKISKKVNKTQLLKKNLLLGVHMKPSVSPEAWGSSRRERTLSLHCFHHKDI